MSVLSRMPVIRAANPVPSVANEANSLISGSFLPQSALGVCTRLVPCTSSERVRSESECSSDRVECSGTRSVANGRTR